MQRRKRIDPRAIGGFVVGAIILSVAGLLFFGPGGFLAETRSYVIYFDSSVNGLTIGSPVRFRGVKIGQVKQINVRVQPNKFKFYIPVIIEIEASKFSVGEANQSIFDEIKATVSGGNSISPLVDNGLRAQLHLDSLVTGRLYVNLDMFPGTPIILTGENSDYPELPAIKSSLEELSQTFEELPLKEISNDLVNIIRGLNKLVSSSDLEDSLANFNNTTDQLNNFIKNMDEQLPTVLETLTETLEVSQSALRSAQLTIDHIDTKIDPLSEQFLWTTQSLNTVAAKTEVVMEQIKGLSAEDSRILKQLSLTLEEINQTARAVRYLSTEIERDPQILLRGRRNGEAK